MDKYAFAKVKKAHLKLAEARGSECTYCPSEVAREVFPESWRNKMNFVREIADDLVKSNQLVVLQKGNIISKKATEAKGPIRLRKKQTFKTNNYEKDF